MRRLSALPIAASALLIAAPTASAWTRAEELTSPSGNATVQGVAIGMNASGQASAIWGYASSYTSPSYAIQASNHTVGASTALGEPSWATNGYISSAASAVLPGPNSNQQPSMAIGVGPSGAATAAWTTYLTGHRQVSAGSTTSDGTFAPPRVLSTPATQCGNTVVDPSVPQVSVGAQGVGHVAWFDTCHSNISPTPLLTQAFNAAGLAASALTTDTQATSAENGSSVSAPVVESVSGDGALVGVLRSSSPVGVAYDRITSSAGDQRVTGSHVAVQAAGSQGVRVAALPGGGQILAWINGGVHVSINDGPDTVIAGTADQYILPKVFSLSSGADGTAVLAWRDWHDDTIWGAVRAPDGAVGAPAAGKFGAAHQLSVDDGDPQNVRTAVSANGVGYAIWTRDTGAFDGVEGSVVDPLDPNRSPGTPWQFQPVADTLINGGFATTNIQAGNALAPAIAVDALGDADVIAPVEIPKTDGSTNTAARYSIAMVENRSTRPPPAEPNATPTPTVQPTPTSAPQPQPTDAPPTDSSAPGPQLPATAAPAPAPPKPTLVVSGFQVSRLYFAAGAAEGKKLSGAHDETLLGRKPALGLRVGTPINVTLSQAATVKVAVTVEGCFDTTLSKHAPGGAKHCTTKSVHAGDHVAAFSVIGKKGANAIRFSDKLLLKGAKLVPGTVYDVAVTGIDAGTGIAVSPGNTPYFRVNVDGPLK